MAGFLPDPRHRGELQRLQRVIQRPGRFRLVLAEYGDSAYLENILGFLAERYPRSVRWSVPVGLDPADLEAHLIGLARDHDPIHLLGLEAWWRSLDGAGLKALNYRRERLAAKVHVTLVLWLGAEATSDFARGAPDLWAWRSAVLDFSLPAAGDSGPVFEHRLASHESDLGRIGSRIAEIGAYLDALERPPGGAEAGLYLERADLKQRQLDFHDALADAQQAHAIYQRLGLDYLGAAAAGAVADILRFMGRSDEALAIRREVELPVYERLGDQYRYAMTMGQIASILQEQGELDEALRIRREEELPVYDKFGDARSRAVALGKVADILQARGELDKALRIHQEEELPVYDKLGDLRSRAAVLGKVADIFQARGIVDEALRIRREEELPVYDKLGDVYSRAATLGKVADLLMARGELDEAIRILREEVLPVYRRGGSMHAASIAATNLAVGLLQQEGGRAEARELLCKALADARYYGHFPEVESIESILDREQLHCV